MKRIIILSGMLIASFTISACAITLPVAAILQKGVILRGTATTANGGSFNVTGPGGLSCGGGYNAFDPSTTLTITALCNDGRTAIITVSRERTGLSGGGKIRLSDGTEGDFIFGDAAARI